MYRATKTDTLLGYQQYMLRGGQDLMAEVQFKDYVTKSPTSYIGARLVLTARHWEIKNMMSIRSETESRRQPYETS